MVASCGVFMAEGAHDGGGNWDTSGWRRWHWYEVNACMLMSVQLSDKRALDADCGDHKHHSLHAMSVMGRRCHWDKSIAANISKFTDLVSENLLYFVVRRWETETA